MKITKKILLIGFLLVFVASAAFSGGRREAPEKTADLVYVNWEEGIAYTHVAAVVLEEMMGYEVNLTVADVGPAYASVAQGDRDAFMETWLPVLHASYMEDYGDDLINLGTIFEGAAVGLVVPQYMVDEGIKTISDLTSDEAIEKLDATITGIDAGAGVMQTTENDAMPAYGLDEAGYQLMASSGPAMMAALQDAIERDEWIVVTGWAPHSKFGYFDLAFLEQDKDEIWAAENIYLLGRKDLREDKPELARFLENMYLTDDEMGDLLVAYSEQSDNPMAMARQWVADNRSVVEKWIP